MSSIGARKSSRRPLSRFLFSAVLFSGIVAAPFGQILAHAASHKDPVVSISAGQIRGALRPNGGAEFLGIPYAQPPVANLRWHEPLPVTPWTGQRIRRALRPARYRRLEQT
jgi:para-nitrobenzyl esterase